MSSNGEPGGNWNGNGFDDDFIVCVLDIFTTEGINFSARSAKELGTFLLWAKDPEKINKTIIVLKFIIFLKFFIIIIF
jgi:hypothetical protein